MDVGDDEIEQAKRRVRDTFIGHASVHAVGIDDGARTLIIYYSDPDQSDLGQIRQEAVKLAAPFAVRLVHSPMARLA
jgi:hypothetical protein